MFESSLEYQYHLLPLEFGHMHVQGSLFHQIVLWIGNKILLDHSMRWFFGSIGKLNPCERGHILE